MNAQQIRYATGRVAGAAEQVRSQARAKYQGQKPWSEIHGETKISVVINALEQGKLKLGSTQQIVDALRKQRYDRDVELFIDEGEMTTFRTGWDNAATTANQAREAALKKIDDMEREILDNIQLGDAADCLESIKQLEELAKSI